MAELSFANGDVVRASWRGRCFGQRIILGMDYTVTQAGIPPGPFDYPTQIGEFLAVMRSAIAGSRVQNYLDILPGDYNLEECRAQRLKGPAGRSGYVVFSYVPALTGMSPDPATVANDSAAITLKSLASGRQSYGTKHIGPLPDGANVNGLISVGYRTLLGNLASALLTGVVLPGSGAVLAPCVWSGRLATVPFEVDRFLIGAQGRVQRRRTVGLGE